ncbi:hypothetical protein AT520_003953 [Escherichia coli]|nr:hypothetical protein [Escherichia coli]EJA4827479.1 hypothetical protein [Escherichia coli]EJI1860915.1 hypothetical protein [Escherichia coli]EJK2348746.1 hypothetical protein [Escherichia coli]HBA9626651.1 hypothetical protein [Escherichia coli]
MSNMPRLGIKRAFEDIIQKELKLKYIQDAFTTGVNKEVQVMIPEMTEDYSKISMQSKLSCNLNITFDIFSEINETGVHKAVYDLISVTATHPKLRDFKINKIFPSSSFTSYNNESSNGQVSAQVVLTLEYIM